MLNASIKGRGAHVGMRATATMDEGPHLDQRSAETVLPQEHTALAAALLEDLRPHLVAAVHAGLALLPLELEQWLQTALRQLALGSGTPVADPSGHRVPRDRTVSRSLSPYSQARSRKSVATRSAVCNSSESGQTEHSNKRNAPERRWGRWGRVTQSLEGSGTTKAPCGVRGPGGAGEAPLQGEILVTPALPRRCSSPKRAKTSPEVFGAWDDPAGSSSTKRTCGVSKFGGFWKSGAASGSRTESLDGALSCVPRHAQLGAKGREPDGCDPAGRRADCGHVQPHPAPGKRIALRQVLEQAHFAGEYIAELALEPQATSGGTPVPWLAGGTVADPPPPPTMPIPGAPDFPGPTWLPSLRRCTSAGNSLGTPKIGTAKRSTSRSDSTASCSMRAAGSSKDTEIGQAAERTGGTLARADGAMMGQRGRTFMRDGIQDNTTVLRNRTPKEQTPTAQKCGHDLSTVFGDGPSSTCGSSRSLQSGVGCQIAASRGTDASLSQQALTLPNTIEEYSQSPGHQLLTPESPSVSSARNHSSTPSSALPDRSLADARRYYRRSSTSSSESTSLRIEREDELLQRFTPAGRDGSVESIFSRSRRRQADWTDGTAIPESKLRQVGSPLLLRICSIIPCAPIGMVHRPCTLLLAACSVGVFLWEFARAQRSFHTPADCPRGVCMHFQCFSDLLLAVGTFLGLLAMGKLDSMRLLGRSTGLLVRYAVEHKAVRKWSSASFWQVVYLAVLWVSSIIFRVMTIWPDPSWSDTMDVAVFTLTSFLFMGLVFGILHVNCLICVLIDSYAMRVRETQDFERSVVEWDNLTALLRKASRAVHYGFLLVQATAVAMLLCSFSDLILAGGEVWWFVSSVLLAQSLVVLFFKAAEVTEMCNRVPSLVNSMKFEGSDFNLERHLLVEHITYSAAGFYIGETRLTATMALKLVYISALAAFGVLTKLTGG